MADLAGVSEVCIRRYLLRARMIPVLDGAYESR